MKNRTITNRQLILVTGVIVVFFILISIICNLYLSFYEYEEKYEATLKRFNALHSYFDKFRNISYPISYSLSFYERYYELPTIYIITPTYARPTQLADLTRLRNTLWLVPKVMWIIVEDSKQKTEKITTFLDYGKLQYVHLNAETPDDMKIAPGDKPWAKPRGVIQRNTAVSWIREHGMELDRGVVYFADDDNTYDIRIFEEMRTTQKVSVWPVAFVGELLYEGPKCKDGKVTGWLAVWKPNRPFPLDMAGFAVNLRLLLTHPSAMFSHLTSVGMQESHFLAHLVQEKDLEARADNCTKILVWHTNTKKPILAGEALLKKNSKSYDESILKTV